MVKFIANSEGGKKLVGLGLTEENVKRLKKGEPILIKGLELDLDFDIGIFYGETEAQIWIDFKNAGVEVKQGTFSMRAMREGKKDQ